MDSRSPVRSCLAIFRLVHWLRPPRRADETLDEVFYSDSRGQNPLEVWCVSVLFHLTWVLLICGALSHVIESRSVLWPIIFVGASLLTTPLQLVIMSLAEPLVRWSRGRFPSISSSEIHSLVQQAVLLFASFEATLDAHWVRWVGRIWIALVVIEILARLVEAVTRREVEPSVS